MSSLSMELFLPADPISEKLPPKAQLEAVRKVVPDRRFSAAQRARVGLPPGYSPINVFADLLRVHTFICSFMC